jgi:hypothetical protein
MIKARPKYPTDLYDNIYIDNIQKAVVICLIIPTTFPFDAGSSKNNTFLWRHAGKFPSL